MQSYLTVTPDQMASAGGYISREWGDYGYRIEDIQSPTHAVSLFHVVASDGACFSVAADKWGNCRYQDTHGLSESQRSSALAPLVAEMHAGAVAP